MEEMRTDLSKVWHKRTDVPEKGGHILILECAIDRSGCERTFFEDWTVTATEHVDWQSFARCYHVLQWCYVDEIFYDKTMED